MSVATIHDLTGRSQLRLTGADRAKFLHNFCTNDILKLPAGGGCELCLCNAKGRILGHGTVFATAEALWLDSVPGAGPKLWAHLDRYLIREAVTIDDLTADWGLFALWGQDAPEWLSMRFPDEPAIREFAEMWNTPGIRVVETTTGLQCRRVDWLGEPMVIVAGPRAEVSRVQAGLSAAGALPASHARWETRRIAAGWPEYGVDVTEEHLPQELARNERLLSFTKGCYLGQEPIARLDALGHTNRELRRLTITGVEPVAPGTSLLDPASGESVGTITSAAVDQSGTGWVGLGYVKTRANRPGMMLDLAGDAAPRQVTVGGP